MYRPIAPLPFVAKPKARSGWTVKPRVPGEAGKLVTQNG